MDAVSYYLNQILALRLRSYGVSERFLLFTIDTINTQMTSLLRHWDDRVFRNTVLLLGLEEGSYYEPPCKIEVRCFVVVTIRNSPIETMQSDAFEETGLDRYLSSQNIKDIAGEAIRYFSTQDFEVMCKQAKNSGKPDLYLNLKQQYPVCWTALEKLAMTSAKTVDYPKAPFDVPYTFEEWVDDPDKKLEKKELTATYFDAYTYEFDPILIELLQGIVITPGSSLVVDAFKIATRNVEKLLKTIEFLLTRDHAFVTSNFYLENGHVERRIKPLRAAHTTDEMRKNFSQFASLGHKHKAILKRYYQSL